MFGKFQIYQIDCTYLRPKGILKLKRIKFVIIWRNGFFISRHYVWLQNRSLFKIVFVFFFGGGGVLLLSTVLLFTYTVYISVICRRAVNCHGFFISIFLVLWNTAKLFLHLSLHGGIRHKTPCVYKARSKGRSNISINVQLDNEVSLNLCRAIILFVSLYFDILKDTNITTGVFLFIMEHGNDVLSCKCFRDADRLAVC